MIKLRTRGRDGHELVLIGLSTKNVGKLLGGEPIAIEPAEAQSLGLGECSLVIFAGESELAMMRELEDVGLLPEGTAAKAAEELERHGRASGGNGAS